MKRTDYISWDDYFMGISLLSGMRSKDPSTQVGACIVDKDNRIVSIGYNGFLNGCRIYVNLFPCHDCARNIIQSGIKTVYYLEDKYADTDSIKASKYMFEKAKVELIQLTPQVDKIEINFNKK